MYLETSKAAAAGKRDKAHVGWGGGGLGLVHNQRSVLEVSAAILLHLPELLQSLHHVHCNQTHTASPSHQIFRPHTMMLCLPKGRNVHYV